MPNEAFSICGLTIPFNEIRRFEVILREYVFRPTFREQPNSKKCVFYAMEPYASVISKDEYDRLTLSKTKLTSSAIQTTAGAIALTASGIANIIGGFTPEEIIAGVAVNTVGKVVNKVTENVETPHDKEKIYCKTAAGRVFRTTLRDIPPIIYCLNGQVIQATKKEARKLLSGEHTTASVFNVPVLHIYASSEYHIYGSGIHVANSNAEYDRLSAEYKQYRDWQAQLQRELELRQQEEQRQRYEEWNRQKSLYIESAKKERKHRFFRR